MPGTICVYQFTETYSKSILNHFKFGSNMVFKSIEFYLKFYSRYLIKENAAAIQGFSALAHFHSEFFTNSLSGWLIKQLIANIGKVVSYLASPAWYRLILLIIDSALLCNSELIMFHISPSHIQIHVLVITFFLTSFLAILINCM